MTTTSIPKFTIDGLDESWPAVRYGERWNGWATPVVERQTLEAVMTAARSEVTLTWTGDVAVITHHDQPDEPDELPADAGGLYDLGLLGWCLIETDFWQTHPDIADISDITDRFLGLRALDLDPTTGASIFVPSEALPCDHCEHVRATVSIGVEWSDKIERLCAECIRRGLVDDDQAR